MRIVQAVVLVAPPVLILWMGGTYLYECGLLLLDPGVPVQFDYKSPEGPVRLWADGYRIDPDHRAASLHGLRATRANGQRIASVEAIQANGLDPFNLRPDVKIRGVRARVVRDAKGFDLARLLPPKKGPPSTIPYAVTVLDAQVVYEDRTFKKPLTQVVATNRFAFDGVGDDWRGEGRARLPGIGEADVRAQGLPNVGTTVDLRSDRLRLERAARSLVPGLKVRRLEAFGPVKIDLPTKGAFRVATTMRALAEGVVYGRYALDRASFQGRASEQGIEGAVEATRGAVTARFEGSATREAGGGRVLASVPSPAALAPWVRAYLPPKVGFSGAAYEGWVAWRGKSLSADGTASTDRATYAGDAVEALRARVVYSPRRIDVRGLAARWQGTPLAGDLTYDPATRAIQGAALAPKVPLAALARRFGQTSLGLGGTVGGEVLLSGTLAKPQIEGRVSGRVALKGRDLGDVEARGAWLAGAARVDRLRVSGPLGAIVAGGTVRPDGTVALKAEARGIRLQRLAPEAQGLVSANLEVGGTLRDPKATGRLEAYRLAYGAQTLPALGLDLVADRRRIDLRNVAAVRGTARLNGRVGVALTGPGVRLANPKSWLLDGRLALAGVQANELPGAERMDDLAGLLSVPRADLSGRLGDPVLKADLRGDGLLARGVRLDAVRGVARIDKRGARLTDLQASGAGGTVAGSGTYDFARKNGDVDLSVADLDLGRLLSDVSQDVTVEGKLSAPQIHLKIRDGKPFGQAEGTLSAVTVNGVLAGDGNWSLDANGARVTAVASIGRLDPVLRALDATATYDVSAGSLAATLQAKDLPLPALVAAAEARRASSESEAQRLSTVAGDLSGTVDLFRSREGDLRIDAKDLRAADVRYLDIDYGTLTATSLARRGPRWTLAGARLDGAAGAFALDGWVEEDGALEGTVSGENVKVAAFSPFEPDLAQVAGTARFSLVADGTVRSPHVRGSLGADGLFATEARENLAISLDRIDVRDGASSLSGVVRYGERFGGLFTATSGWAYREDYRGAPVTAKLDLGTLGALDPADPSRGLQIGPVSLTDVPGLGAYVDPKRGGGTLTGSFAVAGTLGAPKLSGGVSLQADRLGITIPGGSERPVAKIDDDLKNVKATLGFDARNAPKLEASTEFERGGLMTLMATLGDLGDKSVFDTLREQRDWKNLPVVGFVDMSDRNRVTIRQAVAGGTTLATLDGRLDAKGTAAAPDLTGTFEVSNFETSLPTLGESSGEAAKPFLDPTFKLRINLAKDGKEQPGRFKTATADLYLNGGATVNGSLSNLRVNADFVTDRGSIRLPGGVVRVDRGGQISFAYRPALAAGTSASAEISILGRSQITVNRQGLGTQRYDVTLDMNGDLLRENGLKFEATSDPSDLSEAEILNALGGTQYLQAIAGGGSSTERSVRNAFAGFALPGLLDPVTSGLGKLLGLDYLGLEYNQYDFATVAFVRNLPYGFSFQGRQQVGTPPPGFRAIYDLRLSYNPAAVSRKLRKLGRFTFSVGTDQDRPFKVSTEYGTRFGQKGKQSGEKHVLFPKKP